MEDIYNTIRSEVFTLKAEDIGISLENNKQVYAAVVDLKVKNNYATLVCIFDGTVSLYYSSGKCEVGLGEKDKVKKAAMSLLISSGQCVDAMKKVTQYPCETKYMQVYLLLKDGIYKKSIENDKAETKEGNFLNFLVQNVLNSIRESASI